MAQPGQGNGLPAAAPPVQPAAQAPQQNQAAAQPGAAQQAGAQVGAQAGAVGGQPPQPQQPQQPAAQPQFLHAQQFADFMAQDREHRAANFNSTTERQMADTQAKRIPVCDGSSAELVREWIQNVDLSTYYTTRPVYVAAHSSTGPLRRELERFLGTQANRHQIPWDAVRSHLQEAFLTPLEEDRLRDQLTRIEQTDGETIASYNRRYIELADRAYPRPGLNLPRNADQNRTLLEHYIRGLRDDHVADRLVTHGHPQDHEQAVTMAQEYARDVFRLRLARRPRTTPRQEEPMEIGAVHSGARPKDPQRPPLAPEGDIHRKVDGLARQLTKLISIMERPHAAALPQLSRSPINNLISVDDRPQLYNEQGKPICNYCQKKGHVASECRKRMSHQQRRGPGPNNGNQGGH